MKLPKVGDEVCVKARNSSHRHSENRFGTCSELIKVGRKVIGIKYVYNFITFSTDEEDVKQRCAPTHSRALVSALRNIRPHQAIGISTDVPTEMSIFQEEFSTPKKNWKTRVISLFRQGLAAKAAENVVEILHLKARVSELKQMLDQFEYSSDGFIRRYPEETSYDLVMNKPDDGSQSIILQKNED